MDEIRKDSDESWDPPSYVGVFNKGDIVDYHCRNDEIAWIEQQFEKLESGLIDGHKEARKGTK